jgi:hypothetical protein
MSLRRFLSSMLISAVALSVPSLLSAQSQDAPKVEVFGGYSWYHPSGTLDTTVVNNSVVVGGKVPEFKKGWGGQFTYNLNHWAGIALDTAGHYNDFGNAHSLAFGPQFKLRSEHVTEFAEAFVGVQHLGPKLYHDHNGATVIAGGGIDYSVTSRFSIRPIQADYVYAYYNGNFPHGRSNGVRLQAGLVFKFGLPTQEGKVSATCSAEPTAVDTGAPVKIVFTPAGFLPKRTLSYSYASTGGKIAGTTTTASVDTTGLAPGSYTVTAKAVDNGKGTHQQTANCETAFSVNEPPKHPPVVSVSAEPNSLKAGDAATITATGSSPDNRPLSYNCTATAGRLTGNGPTYTLDTAGVPDSTIGVNCTVSDDRNLTATASTSVKVNVPPPPPVANDFGAIEFKHDLKRPTRVDNEAKGELDRYADALAAAPDAKGVVVGYATSAEDTAKKGSKKTPEFAAERAVNTKDYMTTEKGIDAARIEPRTGTGDDQKTELWIVPAGATFPAEGTKVVDETKVKAIPRIAPPAKKAAHKKAPKS